MSSPDNPAMRFTLLRRRFTISAPRMAIRAHVPWPIRVFGYAIVLGLAAAVAMWAYDLGSRFAGFNKGEVKEELARLRSDVATLRAERDALKTASLASQSELTMERASQSKMADQVKALEAEVAQLKEETAFYESLIPATTAGPGVSIRNLRAQLDPASNTMRYRLLVMQTGRTEAEFRGQIRLDVSVQSAGKTEVVSIPSANGGSVPALELAFRRVQRVEGEMQLPKGVTVKSVIAKVMQGGAVRAQVQTVPS